MKSIVSAVTLRSAGLTIPVVRDSARSRVRSARQFGSKHTESVSDGTSLNKPGIGSRRHREVASGVS